MLWAIALSASYICTTTFNLVVIEKKKKKVLTNLEEKLKNSGYEINKKYIKNFFSTFDSNAKDIEFDWNFSFVPGLNLFYVITNIQYLLGDYSNDEIWDKLENLDINENLDTLIKNDYVRQIYDDQWIKDRENALVKLEAKYDDIIQKGIDDSKEKDILIIAKETDSIEELLKKQERLNELIKRKSAQESLDTLQNVYDQTDEPAALKLVSKQQN